MILASGTTMNENEVYKALISRKGLKDLVDGNAFEIQEMLYFVPEEHEKDEKDRVALKIGGVYYSGVSNEVKKTVVDTLGFLHGKQEEEVRAFLEAITYKMVKEDVGRYGRIYLEAVG